MHHKYVLDKILHNNKFLSSDFLVSENLYSNISSERTIKKP